MFVKLGSNFYRGGNTEVIAEPAEECDQRLEVDMERWK